MPGGSRAGAARRVHRPDLAERRRGLRGGTGNRAGADREAARRRALGGRRPARRPGAGGAALGVPLSEVLDQRMDADDLPGVPRGRLPGSLSPEEAMRRIAAIAAQMVTERPPDRLVLEAARLLGRPGARAELVAGQLGIGERQLRRRCQAAVGYGPRMLNRVLRFRRFVSRIDAGGDFDLATIAAEAGYADPAHLTRESNDLAGLTPAALVRARR